MTSKTTTAIRLHKSQPASVMNICTRQLAPMMALGSYTAVRGNRKKDMFVDDVGYASCRRILYISYNGW